MARIAGVDLPNKHIDVSLTYIYGIGRVSAREICKKVGINAEKLANDLSTDEISNVRQVIENEYMVEGRLRTHVAMNIKRLMDTGSYRGIRHRKGLPTRGQNTQKNARTRKGKKKTVAGKKK